MSKSNLDKIFYIKWFDASFNDTHQSMDEMEDEFIIETVGIFVKESKRYFTVATEYIPRSGCWRYAHHIPKVNILKKKRLT